MARLVVLWVASTALAILIAALMQYFGNPTFTFDQFLANIGGYLWPLLLAFGVTLPIAVLQLLRFTHRFAGPVLRLRSELRQLANGEERPPLKFRENDYWQDLAIHFNRVADELTARRGELADPDSDASPADTLPPLASV